MSFSYISTFPIHRNSFLFCPSRTTCRRGGCSGGSCSRRGGSYNRSCLLNLMNSMDWSCRHELGQMYGFMPFGENIVFQECLFFLVGKGSNAVAACVIAQMWDPAWIAHRIPYSCATILRWLPKALPFYSH